MTTNDHVFCRALLAETRKDLPEGAPEKLSTTGPMFRDMYLVEDDSGFASEVEGCCKWAAQAAALNRWLRSRAPAA